MRLSVLIQRLLRSTAIFSKQHDSINVSHPCGPIRTTYEERSCSSAVVWTRSHALTSSANRSLLLWLFLSITAKRPELRS